MARAHGGAHGMDVVSKETDNAAVRSWRSGSFGVHVYTYFATDLRAASISTIAATPSVGAVYVGAVDDAPKVREREAAPTPFPESGAGKARPVGVALCRRPRNRTVQNGEAGVVVRDDVSSA